MSPLMLTLAAELADAEADSDAAALAAIAWRLYGQAGEGLAEITRLRAVIYIAWNRPRELGHARMGNAWRSSAGARAGRGPGVMSVVATGCGLDRWRAGRG